MKRKKKTRKSSKSFLKGIDKRDKTRYYIDNEIFLELIKKDVLIMTIARLKTLTEQLPPDAIVLIDTGDKVADVELLNIEYHTDGRSHLILSNKE